MVANFKFAQTWTAERFCGGVINQRFTWFED